METQVTKDQLLEKVAQERGRLNSLINQVGEDRVAVPGVEGKWSVKDIIAHITFWEERLARRLQGKPASAPLIEGFADLTEDEENEVVYKHYQDKAWQDILVEYEDVHKQLLGGLEGLSDDDVNDPTRFEWMRGSALHEAIEGNSYGHYQHHAPAIAAWLDAGHHV